MELSVLAWKLEQIEASDSCVDSVDPSVAINPHHGMSVGYVYNISYTRQVNTDITTSFRVLGGGGG